MKQCCGGNIVYYFSALLHLIQTLITVENLCSEHKIFKFCRYQHSPSNGERRGICSTVAQLENLHCVAMANCSFDRKHFGRARMPSATSDIFSVYKIAIRQFKRYKKQQKNRNVKKSHRVIILRLTL